MRADRWRHIAICLCALVGVALGGRADMPKLRWVDDDKARNAVSNVVMKILREDKSLSYGDPKSGNILVHGDNLEALKALLPFYAGRVKCIYIDPPYNTGNAFPNYDDNLEHSIWMGMMYPRIKLLKEFLAADGCFFMQLDDNELDYAKVICDEIFGRKNFVNRITIDVRAPSAFSTVNPGVFKCSEYILWYSINKQSVPMVEERVVRDVDFAYKLWLKNPNENYERWEWCGVAEAYAQAKAQKKPSKNETPVSEYKKYQDFIIKNANRIFRMASISDTGAGQEVLDLKKKSIETPGKILFMHREKHDDVYVINGEQIIFYAKNVRMVDGKLRATKQITNIWNDIPWEGIASEGGVVLKKSKKPEKLIQRILSISTKPGDVVLDSFLGSGTTAAVAHKMGRRWIGVELGDHARTLCVPRMKAVCTGEQSGISKQVGWQGGGGFKFYELGEPLLDENGAISEGIDFDTLAAHIWWRETGSAWDVATRNGTFLGVHDGVAYAMLYNGVLHDRSYAGGNVLTPKTMRIIREDIGEAKYGRLVVYGECTKLGAAKLREENVEFRQTPYDIVTRR